MPVNKTRKLNLTIT